MFSAKPGYFDERKKLKLKYKPKEMSKVQQQLSSNTVTHGMV